MKFTTLFFLSSIVLASGQRYLKRGNGNGQRNGNGNGNGGGGGGGSNGNGNGNGAGMGSTTLFLDVTPGPVNSDEQAKLTFMIQEEKMAGDVYAKLYETYQLRIFQNIGNSEARHESMVRQALQLHGIPDPTSGKEPGVFEDESLQASYTTLVTSGLQSLTDALRVGVAIEEEDIKDLQSSIQDTTPAHLIEMYERLMLASQNHLAAFTRLLDDTEQDP